MRGDICQTRLQSPAISARSGTDAACMYAALRAALKHLVHSCCCRMELAVHREEELGGPLGHLTELGVPQNLLNFSGVYTERTSNTVLKAASKLQAASGNECYQHCLADSRYLPVAM